MARLTEIQYKAMELRLNGFTIDEIARELNVKRTTVHSWFYKNETFMAEYEAIREENVERAKNILLSYAVEAAQNVISIASGEKRPGNVSARTQLDANKDILDRVGLKPVEKREVDAKIDANAEFVAVFDEENK